MPEAADIGFTARCLLRAARQASLATVVDGAPFVSLVTPAASCGGDLLMLISGLSQHARHLRLDGRCALLLCGAERHANPQTTPRVTVTGTAEPVQDLALRDRWLRIHPYGALYAGLGDFSLWHLRPEQAHLVAGFGQARRLSGPALAAACDLSAEETSLCEAANQRHAAMLPQAVRIVAVDADGLDLGPAASLDPNGSARSRRIAFAVSAGTPDAVPAAIASALQAAG